VNRLRFTVLDAMPQVDMGHLPFELGFYRLSVHDRRRERTHLQLKDLSA